MEQNKQIPIVAIMGPTASGKTAAAIQVAKRFNGEIISADSIQIYEGLDIASAKPTKEEQSQAVHHLVGCIPMGTAFSVSDYISMAKPIIADIHSRGKLPILCGGAGLYISSLLSNVQLTEVRENPQRRAELYTLAETKGNEAVHEILRQLDLDGAEKIHPNNLVRVIRAIEICEGTGKTLAQCNEESHSIPSCYNALQIGLGVTDRAYLYDRINLRVDKMLEEGLVEEAKQVYETEQLRTLGNAIGYKELIPYFEGTASLEACVEKIKQSTRHYAKRQLTWFNKNKDLLWINIDEYADLKTFCEHLENIVAKWKCL